MFLGIYLVFNRIHCCDRTVKELGSAVVACSAFV